MTLEPNPWRLLDSTENVCLYVGVFLIGGLRATLSVAPGPYTPGQQSPNNQELVHTHEQPCQPTARSEAAGVLECAFKHRLTQCMVVHTVVARTQHKVMNLFRRLPRLKARLVECRIERMYAQCPQS